MNRSIWIKSASIEDKNYNVKTDKLLLWFFESRMLGVKLRGSITRCGSLPISTF